MVRLRPAPNVGASGVLACATSALGIAAGALEDTVSIQAISLLAATCVQKTLTRLTTEPLAYIVQTTQRRWTTQYQRPASKTAFPVKTDIPFQAVHASRYARQANT